MIVKLRMTGKSFYNLNPNSNHVVNCVVDDTIIESFTLTDDELCSISVYQRGKFLGYIGRDGLVNLYGNAELINGRFEPKIFFAEPGITFRKVESFYLGVNGVSRKRTLH